MNFMKIRCLLIILFISAALSLSAEGTQEFPPETASEGEIESELAVTDSLERRVIFSRPPRRILQAGSSAFIINNALFLFPEARERVIAMVDSNQGRGHFLKVIDPTYAEKTILSRRINMEEILSARPELIVLKDFHHGRYDKEFQNIDIPVVYLNLESPEGWQEDLQVIGALFGNSDRANQLKELFDRYIGRVKEPLADLPREDRKRGLILYYSEKDGSGAFQVPPLNFIQTRMLEMAGGDPVWVDADIGERWTKVGFEQIAAWDPDQIFLISYRKPMAEVLSIIEKSGYWRELRAYREEEIHPFPGDFYSWDQPDPRWLLGLQWLAVQTQS